MVYPEFIARFYDLIYQHVRNGTDNEFFLSKACHSRGKVLEIGVGTGRLFLNALNRGVDIYGIDISPAMINVLHGKMNYSRMPGILSLFARKKNSTLSPSVFFIFMVAPLLITRFQNKT